MSVESETAVIHLGGRDFSVEAFTFDQLQKMMPAFAKLRQGLAEGGLEAARDIIAAALADSLPVEELGRLRTNVVEILDAVPVVARLSGLSAVGEALAGISRAP